MFWVVFPMNFSVDCGRKMVRRQIEIDEDTDRIPGDRRFAANFQFAGIGS